MPSSPWGSVCAPVLAAGRRAGVSTGKSGEGTVRGDAAVAMPLLGLAAGLHCWAFSCACTQGLEPNRKMRRPLLCLQERGSQPGAGERGSGHPVSPCWLAEQDVSPERLFLDVTWFPSHPLWCFGTLPALVGYMGWWWCFGVSQGVWGAACSRRGIVGALCWAMPSPPCVSLSPRVLFPAGTGRGSETGWGSRCCPCTQTGQGWAPTHFSAPARQPSRCRRVGACCTHVPPPPLPKARAADGFHKARSRARAAHPPGTAGRQVGFGELCTHGTTRDPRSQQCAQPQWDGCGAALRHGHRFPKAGWVSAPCLQGTGTGRRGSSCWGWCGVCRRALRPVPLQAALSGCEGLRNAARPHVGSSGGWQSAAGTGRGSAQPQAFLPQPTHFPLPSQVSPRLFFPSPYILSFLLPLFSSPP